MKNQERKTTRVPASACDRTSRLSVPDTFALFMDIATDHANSLGIGMPDLAPRDLFWLTVKTRVVFHRRPAMNETVSVETWAEMPERIRWIRNYRLTAGDEVLADGKTEWTIINTQTGRLHPAPDICPEGLEPRERVWDEPFARLRDDFDGEPVFARYTVRSTDIDLGGHMNNVAYVRALAGAFSTGEWEELNVQDLEIHFKASCYEGQTIEMQRRERDGGLDIRMSVEGKTVVLVRIG